MVEITSTEMTPSTDDSREFRPMRGISNRHLQTMLPRLIRHKVKFGAHWQCLELPDGDSVDLAWSEGPQQMRHKPRPVVFYGLEGSLNSLHVHDLIEAAQKRGWLGVITHFRDCSGEPNHLNRICHSGETGDGTWFLHWLEREFSRVPTVAVGYSLSENVLAYLLAKGGDDIPIDAAVIVSAPLALEAYSYHMDKGFSRVYQRRLSNLLKANASRRLEVYPSSLPASLTQSKPLRHICDFDDLITARIHGFTDAIDYYRQCSVMPLLSRIVKPTLITHAKDDPFIDHYMIPKSEDLPSQVEYQLTEHDGHVGFIGDAVHRPETWLESRVPDRLTTYLEASS